MSARGSLAFGTIVLASSLAAVTTATSGRADDAASTLSPPPLAFSVAAPAPGAGGGPWRLHIENTGDVPVRIAADPRLLMLEVTPPAGFVDEASAKAKRRGAAPASKKADEPKTVRCVLPGSARPSTDEGCDLVVPGKRSWSAMFDPLMVCFGARERAVLVKGATVKASFGWPTPAPKRGARAGAKTAVPTAPFVAAPVGAAIGRVAPAKELEAPPITLSEDVVPAPPPAPVTEALTITMPAALDVARGNEISTTVTLTNKGDKSVVVLFRPEMLRFTVAGPAGSVSCGSPRAIASPIRELYSTLRAGSRVSTSLLITAICPADTFDEPGVYRITPELDTTNASARSIGLRTWDGTVSGQSPMLLRVRSPRRPPTDTSGPTLD